MPLNQLGAAPLVSKTGSKLKAASAVSCFHPRVSGDNQNNETNILARGDIPGGKMQFSKFSELYAVLFAEYLPYQMQDMVAV